MHKLGGSFSQLKCTEVLSVAVHLHKLQLCIALCRSCEHEPCWTGESGLRPCLWIIDLKVDHVQLDFSQ